MISNIIKEIHPKITLNMQLWDFSMGLKNEFEPAVLNELSVFEPLKFDYIPIDCTDRAPDKKG